MAQADANENGTEGAVQQAAAVARREVEKSAKQISSKAKSIARQNVKQVASTVQDEATGFGAVVVRATQAGAKEFEDAGYQTVASYAGRLSDNAAEFAKTIDGFDVDAIVRKASTTVSKNPALAIGTMAALGFLGAMAVANINKQSD